MELAPSAQQTANSMNHLINLKLVSTDPVNHRLGTPGANALISLSASGTYPDNSTHDKERFRVDNDGSILSVADYTGGVNTTAPVEGSGTRFMWYAAKAALRAGQINGTQWDDANIGLYSTAFGENVRALGDNAIVVGKNSVAANTGTVALGEGHTATGANSVALGYGASTSTIAGSPRTGTFVFSDRSVPLTYSFNSTTPDIGSQFHPTVTNSFNVRAVNGSFFYTNTALTTGFIFNSTTATMTLTNSKLSMASDGSTTLTSNSGGSAGVTLPAGGGSWNNLSDRNMKANFAAVDTRAVLRGVLSLPDHHLELQDAGAFSPPHRADGAGLLRHLQRRRGRQDHRDHRPRRRGVGRDSGFARGVERPRRQDRRASASGQTAAGAARRLEEAALPESPRGRGLQGEQVTAMRHSLISVLLLSLLLSPARGQSGPQVTQSSVAGGGGVSTQGTLRVEGIIGQSSAGASSGGTFTLNGGFYAPGQGPSVLSVVRTSASPATQNSSVGYAVTFDEPVTGVDAADFQLTTTGLNGASVTGVSGSGATYDVTVNAGTPASSAAGTLRLDVVDDDTVVNAGGDLLGGTGAGNGNFNSGEVYTVEPFYARANDAQVSELPPGRFPCSSP